MELLHLSTAPSRIIRYRLFAEISLVLDGDVLDDGGKPCDVSLGQLGGLEIVDPFLWSFFFCTGSVIFIHLSWRESRRL